MEGDLRAAAASLVALCAPLGITADQLAAVEGPDELAHGFTVTGAAAASVDLADARHLREAFGDAAKVEFRTGDLTELVVGPAATDEEIAAFRTRAASGGPYEVLINVDKAALANRLAGPTPRRSVRVYLFAAALRRALARGISRFETEVWPQAPEPLVISVADTDIALTGQYLSVFGGSGFAGVAGAAGTLPPEADIMAVFAARDRYVGWDTPWVRGLTPWHFELSGTCADPELHALLRAQLVKLAVLFTCDRARPQPAGVLPALIRAEYRGREHVAVIPIDERQGLDVPDTGVSAILDATDWCYRRGAVVERPDWLSDRLPFLQTRIAQALEPHPESDRLPALVRAMPYLLEGIEWHWKAFIEDKVGEYLTGVSQVESAVNETVSSFAERSAALAKGLSDSILAAVAVLIGSFIAAAFRTPFSATLFRIGVVTYAAYVALFPGALGLLVAHRGLRLARAGFDSRVIRFKETLYSGKVDEIVGNRVGTAQASFYKWLALVAILYVAIAAAALVAADVVPQHVKDHGPVSPTTPTHTTLPPTSTTTAASTTPPFRG